MKNIPVHSLFLLLLLLPVRIPAYSQTGRQRVSIEDLLYGKDLPTTMVLKEVTMGRLIATDAINDRVRIAFEKRFASVSNCTWYAFNKRYQQFGVRFRYNDECAVAVFTKRGHLIYSAACLPEEQLSKGNRKLIHSNFKKSNIINTVEVQNATHWFWVIELQEASYDILFVYVENGTLEVLSRYESQKIRNLYIQ